MALQHPFTGEPLHIEIAPEPALVDLFAKLGWGWPVLPALAVEPALA